MTNRIQAYIDKHQLLTGKRPVLVGLSGGADSVALLNILTRLGYKCVAAHCNFHLRGEESDRDEQFAGSFSRKHGIPFHKKDFDTRQYAGEKRISIEMAARELRYGWFEELRQTLDAQAIAVAHHQDDNAETLLLNLIRGTGIKGLGGIQPKNGYIIRPLLVASKEDILTWLQEQQLSYVTDSTNLSDKYTRNFIRLRVLPLLEEINPSVKEAITRTSEHLSAARQIYQSVIDEARQSVLREDHSLLIPELMKYPSPETILYELLLPYRFTRAVTGDIFSSLGKESGKIFHSPTHRLIKDREKLLITPIAEKKAEKYVLDTIEGNYSEPIELSFRKTVVGKNFCIEKDINTGYFDYDTLAFPLTLRRWRPGDWFIPFGMKGRKKLSDYFSDKKFSLIDKEQAWLLCSGKDIIWVVGERTDDRYKINKSTNYALIVIFLPKRRRNR